MDEFANMESENRTEGITERVRFALDMFVRATKNHYGDHLKAVLVFGSRARGTAHPQSDLDVAVILDNSIPPNSNERSILANIAYDVIVETGVDVQPMPILMNEWIQPDLSKNPSLIRSIRRDGILYD